MRPQMKKTVRLYDRDGLFLQVRPGKKGITRQWRLAIQVDKKRKLFALGRYPDLNLAAARSKTVDYRRMIEAGLDPMLRATKEEKIEDGVDTLKSIGLRWHASKEGSWTDRYKTRVLQRLENNLFADLGHVPITDLTRVQVREQLLSLEAKGLGETVHTMLGYIREIVNYADAHDIIDHDPTRNVKRALKPRPKEVHRAALIKPDDIGEFLRRLRNVKHQPVLQTLMWTVVLTAQRAQPVRFMRRARLITTKASPSGTTRYP